MLKSLFLKKISSFDTLQFVRYIKVWRRNVSGAKSLAVRTRTATQR